MDEMATDRLEKEAMAKLYNEFMPDEIVPSEKSDIEAQDDIYLKIGMIIKNRESIVNELIFEEKEATFNPGEIEVYKDKIWLWEGQFNGNVLGIFKKGEIFDYPEIISSNQLSNIEKIDILDKLIYEKQLELLGMKDYVAEQLILSLINKFFINPTIEKWRELGFRKIINWNNVLLEDQTEENVYNYFKTLFNIAIYNKNIENIIKYININNLPKIVVPVSASFDLMFSIFEYIIEDKKCYYILYDNNEFKEWS